MRFRRTIRLPLQPHEVKPLRLIADGSVQTVNVANGRFLPVLILDTSTRPDVDEHVRLHQALGEGDVTTSWCKLPEHEVALLLQLSGPTSANLVVGFDLIKHRAVIDQIVQSRGLYLQPGRSGDRLRDTLRNPKIIVEVAESGFDKTWNKILLRIVTDRFVASGLNRTTARKLAEDHIKTWREFTSRRIRPRARPDLVK